MIKDGECFSLLMEGGETDDNPLTAKKLIEFLQQFPEDTEIACDHGCAENITTIDVYETWFSGPKEGRKLIIIS